MKSELPLRLIVIDPPANIDYGIQRGRGSKYEAMFVQQRKKGNVAFVFSITVSDSGKDGTPNFAGEFVQGTPVHLHRRRHLCGAEKLPVVSPNDRVAH